MKKIWYNSWLARTFLFPSYSTITLTVFICTKIKDSSSLPQKVKNHESVHVRQWVEVFIISLLITFIFDIFISFSPWWYILSILTFYIWYVLEWGIKSIITRKNAYKEISFEREARIAEGDNSYLENSDYLGWIKFLK